MKKTNWRQNKGYFTVRQLNEIQVIVEISILKIELQLLIEVIDIWLKEVWI